MVDKPQKVHKTQNRVRIVYVYQFYFNKIFLKVQLFIEADRFRNKNPSYFQGKSALIFLNAILSKHIN